MINWKVRIKNKAFWVAIIPAVLLVIQLTANLFGWDVDTSTISGKLVAIVNAVFSVLVILGIVQDPTTKGVGDSDRALTYEEPN